MAIDVSKVTHGPAQVDIAGTEIGHTAGGVTWTVTPQNRARNVDQFGSSEVAIIHTGDQVRATIPWAEWTAAVLAEVYAPGDDQTGGSDPFLGVGRSAGFIYPDQTLDIIPRLSTHSSKKIEIFKATPIGELSLNHNADDDRIFETEFACTVDESKTDGQLIGKLYVGS